MKSTHQRYLLFSFLKKGGCFGSNISLLVLFVSLFISNKICSQSTLTLQPGAEGKDAVISSISNDDGVNFGNSPDNQLMGFTSWSI